MNDVNYPPEPWNLAGDAFVSGWRLPVNALPELPPQVRPVSLAGSGFVFTAWVDYQRSGLLAYRELMATVAVRNGTRPAACITHIWVDSPVSLAGGRALWNIPKDLAEFEFSHEPEFSASLRTGEGVIAEASYRTVAGSPWAVPSAFSVVQAGPRRSPVRVKGKPAAARTAWKINADGPLAFLSGRKPFASFAIHGFDMRFGRRRQ